MRIIFVTKIQKKCTQLKTMTGNSRQLSISAWQCEEKGVNKHTEPVKTLHLKTVSMYRVSQVKKSCAKLFLSPQSWYNLINAAWSVFLKLALYRWDLLWSVWVRTRKIFTPTIESTLRAQTSTKYKQPPPTTQQTSKIWWWQSEFHPILIHP